MWFGLLVKCLEHDDCDVVGCWRKMVLRAQYSLYILKFASNSMLFPKRSTSSWSVLSLLFREIELIGGCI